jgi:hypothetical protein
MTSLAGISQASVLARPDRADWPVREPPYWSRIVTSHGQQLRCVLSICFDGFFQCVQYPVQVNSNVLGSHRPSQGWTPLSRTRLGWDIAISRCFATDDENAAPVIHATAPLALHVHTVAAICWDGRNVVSLESTAGTLRNGPRRDDMADV